MIGNDVVDLALAKTESNWKRKGFLQKIFTQNEQSFILNTKNPEIKVWELWSRKEAAYKIWNRKTGIRLFNPIRFECFDETPESGKVSFENQTYFTKTIISGENIETVAVCQKSDLERVVFHQNRMGIVKENGIPFLDNKPISISHHGRFESIVSIYNPSLDLSFRNRSPRL